MQCEWRQDLEKTRRAKSREAELQRVKRQGIIESSSCTATHCRPTSGNRGLVSTVAGKAVWPQLDPLRPGGPGRGAPLRGASSRLRRSRPWSATRGRNRKGGVHAGSRFVTLQFLQNRGVDRDHALAADMRLLHGANHPPGGLGELSIRRLETRLRQQKPVVGINSAQDVSPDHRGRRAALEPRSRRILTFLHRLRTATRERHPRVQAERRAAHRLRVRLRTGFPYPHPSPRPSRRSARRRDLARPAWR